jgi:cytochrome c oxidase subunit 7c
VQINQLGRDTKSIAANKSKFQMLSRAALRAAPRQLVTRRGFQTTRAQLSSPYHYPEGPYTNLPFNTKTRFFGLRYLAFCVVGFAAPFGIAGALLLFFLFPRQRSLLPTAQTGY